MIDFNNKYISKTDFLKLNEEDLMFITYPGRMGDEDGSTFVIKQGKDYVVHRIDGWMYPTEDIDEKEQITLSDTFKQFPLWHEAWKHSRDKDYYGKYTCLYMGFGNRLFVDNSIYSKYEPYLNKLVDEYLEGTEDNIESLKYSAIFNTWEEAFVKMIEDNN